MRPECIDCTKFRFQHFTLKESATNTIAQFMEIIASQSHYKPENYRLREQSFKTITANRNRTYTDVWQRSEVTLDQLIEQSDPLFASDTE